MAVERATAVGSAPIMAVDMEPDMAVDTAQDMAATGQFATGDVILLASRTSSSKPFLLLR